LADLATAVGQRTIRRSLGTLEVIPIVPAEWATLPIPDHTALDLISSS
jgi:hypothetical protein